jgi:hypothetical protein
MQGKVETMLQVAAEAAEAALATILLALLRLLAQVERATNVAVPQGNQVQFKLPTLEVMEVVQ